MDEECCEADIDNDVICEQRDGDLERLADPAFPVPSRYLRIWPHEGNDCNGAEADDKEGHACDPGFVMNSPFVRGANDVSTLNLQRISLHEQGQDHSALKRVFRPYQEHVHDHFVAKVKHEAGENSRKAVTIRRETEPTRQNRSGEDEAYREDVEQNNNKSNPVDRGQIVKVQTLRAGS